MILKKKNLIKQVKNFTLNFGPQHPAAHVRRYSQIFKYYYKNLLFFYIFLNIQTIELNFKIDDRQTKQFVYLGSIQLRYLYLILFVDILWIWLTEMNSCFKNVIFGIKVRKYFIFNKKLYMSIYFYLNQNYTLQRKPIIIKVLLNFNNTIFF